MNRKTCKDNDLGGGQNSSADGASYVRTPRFLCARIYRFSNARYGGWHEGPNT